LLATLSGTRLCPNILTSTEHFGLCWLVAG
jgi:hypothetical protein